MGEEPDDSPCPAIKGLEADAKANIKMSDESVVDDVILAGAAATEHHEIAVYQTLMTHADLASPKCYERPPRIARHRRPEVSTLAL